MHGFAKFKSHKFTLEQLWLQILTLLRIWEKKHLSCVVYGNNELYFKLRTTRARFTDVRDDTMTAIENASHIK